MIPTRKAVILFIGRNYGRLPRRAQFGHCALLQPDPVHPTRWVLSQYFNRREQVRIIDDSDFEDHRGDAMPVLQAIKAGMLDVDMNANKDEVTMVEAAVPVDWPWAPVRFFRANDVGYVKSCLGVRSWMIRTPHQLYRFYIDGGPDAVEKAGHINWLRVLTWPVRQIRWG